MTFRSVASELIVRLRLDSNQVAEIEDLALRQGIETIRGRVDKFGVSEPTIIKKGTDIIVELPGLKTQDFDRIKSLLRNPFLLDGRNIWSSYGLRRQGFTYVGIGVQGT